MEKKVQINGKEYTVREIKYLEALEITKHEDLITKTKEMLKISTGLTDEDLSELTMREGSELQKAVDSVNSQDFQDPVESNKN